MKNIHLTYDDRLDIERGLKINNSLTEISNNIDKDIGTVRNEIKKHRIKKYPSTFNGRRNLCIHFINKNCNIKRLCNIDICNNMCSNCNRHFCNDICENYQEYICEHLLQKPYVCNGCPRKSACTYIKMYYYAKDADIEYHKTLSNSRKGPYIDNENINYINKNIVPLVKKGQSFNNIVNADNGINSPVCTQTLYTYTAKGHIELCNIDLPKKVKYKIRTKEKNKDNEKINKLKINRTHDDFLDYCYLNPTYLISEMDTVEGIKGGKVLLTLLFRKSNFMIAILIDNKKAETVKLALDKLKKQLGNTLFNILFRILITDNGVEFTLIEEIEHLEEEKNINLFFCDPGKSGQKGKIEKNHVELRKILPKFTSFDNLTQDNIDLILSHVNSYKRKKLNWKSPMELVEEQFGSELIKLLNQHKIDDKDIVLKPELIKKNI